MFEKILHITVGVARFFLIVFVLAALVAAGANALQLESAATATPEVEATEAVPSVKVDAETGPTMSADDSEEPANDGMTNNSRPWSNVEGCYWSATSLTFSSNGKRATECQSLEHSTDSRCERSVDRKHLTTSRGEVSAVLSHQATLVGAKPSGTS